MHQSLACCVLLKPLQGPNEQLRALVLIIQELPLTARTVLKGDEGAAVAVDSCQTVNSAQGSVSETRPGDCPAAAAVARAGLPGGHLP